MSKSKEPKYVEPDNFFPEEILKKYKLGAYNGEEEEKPKKQKDELRDIVNKE